MELHFRAVYPGGLYGGKEMLGRLNRKIRGGKMLIAACAGGSEVKSFKYFERFSLQELTSPPD